MRLSLGASRGRLVRQLLVESLVLSAAGGVVGLALAFLLTRGLLPLVPTDGQPLLINAYPDARILLFTVALTFLTGIVFGLLPALRASRPDPWTTLKDTVGSIAGTGGSLFLRKGLVTAQVALSFLLLFGAGLFVRSLQNLRDDRHGRRARQPGDVPAVAGAQRLHQRARDAVLHRSARAAALRARRQVGGDCRRVDPERFRMGQLDVGRGPSGEGRRGHAGVHELALAWILRDDEDSAARRAGLPSAATSGRAPRSRSSIASSPSTSSRADPRSASTSGRAPVHGPSSTSKSSASSRTRSTKGPREGVRRQVFVPNWGRNSVDVLRSHADQLRGFVQRGAQRGETARCDDAGLRDEDPRSAARRNASHRSPDRAAVGGLRTAGDDARVDRPLRRHGVRRRAAQEGAGHPAGARRAAGRCDLAGDERGAVAARHWPCRRHSRGDRRRAIHLVAAVWHQPNDPFIAISTTCCWRWCRRQPA